MLKKLVLASIAAVSFVGGAQAVTLLGQDPLANLIVTAGGMEWVYAGPCAGADPSCGVVQLHHGFQFATDAQWSSSFADLAALNTAFTSPSNKCAASYFNTVYDHCDFGDLAQGYVWHSPLAPDDGHRNHAAAETLLVRAASNDVPEPASISLLGLGLVGLAFARKSKKA